MVDPIIPLRQGAISRTERFRTSSRFGSMTGARLSSVLQSAEQGDMNDWADLCEFIENTDDEIAGLFETRRTRVLQANTQIVPGRATPTKDDLLLTSLCRDALDRCENWDMAADKILSAIPVGHSFAEIIPEVDVSRGVVMPRRVEWVHTHRFRFDEQWQPRLYYGADNARSLGHDGYGEYLDPRKKWIHHQVQTGPGYPGSWGVMRSVAWRWLFRRWADTFWIESLDRFGQPFATAKVAPNTPSQVRNELQNALDNLTAEHTAVYEATGDADLEFHTAAAQLDGGNFEKYMNYSIRSLSKRILGTSDGADPGANGSNAAVSTRTASTMDPRTIADARAFWATIRQSLFGFVLYWNRGMFSSEPVLPKVIFDFEADAGADIAKDAFTGDQIGKALDIVSKVNRREILRSQGRAAIAAFYPTLDAQRIDALVGDGGTDDPGMLVGAAPAPTQPNGLP